MFGSGPNLYASQFLLLVAPHLFGGAVKFGETLSKLRFVLGFAEN
jgi:hypothetical protein